jgi:RNA polymerase sigma-70 factor, ECF subfamily
MLRRDPLANPEPLIRRVYAYVAYRVGDGPDAEDLTSETFERALRYRKSYDPKKGEPVAWLLGIAKRCIDGRGPRIELASESAEEATSGDLEAETIRRLTVASAVSTLDERDRELIALRYGADLTARQIAEVLGARTNAIEVALHRALGRLRATFGDEDESASVRKREASR